MTIVMAVTYMRSKGTTCLLIEYLGRLYYGVGIVLTSTKCEKRITTGVGGIFKCTLRIVMDKGGSGNFGPVKGE